jgi:hypothetical protein
MCAPAVLALLATHFAAAAALAIHVGGAVSLSAPRAQWPVPTLSRAKPFRLEVSTTGRVQEIRIHGSDFENEGHPDRDVWMHWQIRRSDGTWQPCSRWNNTPTRTCESGGWLYDVQVLRIGGDYVKRDGFVEIRVFQGPADPRETDPRNAPNPQEWSNVLRVPVVVPGAAPRTAALVRADPPAGLAPGVTFELTRDGLARP